MVLRTNRAPLDPILASDANEMSVDINQAVARTDDLGGGLSGQILMKNSDASHDYLWRNFTGDGGGGGAFMVVVASADTPTSLQGSATYICDGTADQEEIQGAIDELPATGGHVHLLPGNYNITAPIRVDHHGIMLTGSGAASPGNASQNALGTRINLSTGFSGAAAILVQLVSDDAAVSSITLEDFTVDGANVVGGAHGILFRAHSSVLERVRVCRMTGDGVRVEGYAGWACYDTLLSGVISHHNAGAGIHLSTGAQDAHLTNCISFENDSGIRIRGASHQITAPHCYSNRYGVWFDNNGSRTKIIGGKIEGSDQHGILFDNTTAGTSDVQIIGSNFKNNGESTANTYDHIHYGTLSTAAHTRPMVNGCVFSSANPTNGNLARSAIHANSSATQALSITGCNFSGAAYGTAALITASTANVITAANSWGSTTVGKGGARGIATVANNGTITINLARVPTYYQVTATVPGQVAVVDSATAAALTISLQTNSGTAVTTPAPVSYIAEI